MDMVKSITEGDFATLYDRMGGLGLPMMINITINYSINKYFLLTYYKNEIKEVEENKI